MSLWDAEVLDLRSEIKAERRQLLGLLCGLPPGDWSAPTAAPDWNVKAVALHLLDDDLGWLSRGRDRDLSGNLDMGEYPAFVDALAAKNQRWIDGAAGLSPQVIVDLLEWSGHQMDDYYAAIDLSGAGGVIWASDGDVPQWFDIAQDFTERWVHQMQIREAVNRVEGFAERYLPAVLNTFIWALPHQFKPAAVEGACINIDHGLTDRWHLISDGLGNWTLHPWRMLTGADHDRARVEVSGSAQLAEGLFNVRGIIV